MRAAAPTCSLDGGDHARMAVADVQHRDPGEEVEVLVAVGVPQPASRAAHELDRAADVGADRVVALERLQLGERHGGAPCGRDLGPLAGVGEQLQQQRVRHAAVDDVRGADAGPHRLQARRELRPHAAADAARAPPAARSAVASETRLLGIVGVAQPAGDVGQEHHLVGAERARDGAGGLVGVDVVGVALARRRRRSRRPGCSPARCG